MIKEAFGRPALVVCGTLALGAFGAWVDEGLGRDALGMFIIVLGAIFCGPGTFFYASGASPLGCVTLLAGAFAALAFGVGLSLEINTRLLREHGVDAECRFQRRLPPPSENSRRWRLECPDGRTADLTTDRLTRNADGLVPVRYDPRGRTDAVEAADWESRSENPWPRRMLFGGGAVVVCLPFAAAWTRPLEDDDL
ncbi:hypothetical protein [Actinomadura sediminis]|uniref:DUF3592 domain-containing protein n=1 Tax=Actinomadura sediminis TaxID=1038904 RepID=A0ABW3ELT1_9ACTN